jgi:hypothetical protein
MWTDPDNLLPEDKTLLDEGFVKLGAVDVSDQAYWITEMESALKAATHNSVCKSLHDNQHRNPPTAAHCPAAHIQPTVIADKDPIFDTGGSINYRRQKKN